MFGFTQPIEMRVDELVAGVKADVAVLIYGDDLDMLARKGKEIERVLADDSRRRGRQSRHPGEYFDVADSGQARAPGAVRHRCRGR